MLNVTIVSLRLRDFHLHIYYDESLILNGDVLPVSLTSEVEAQVLVYN